MILSADLLNDPNLQGKRVSYARGQLIFLEGDRTKDLYILVSGEVEVIKGEKLLTIISEPGSLFGEMSMLLGETRTATIKARTDVEVIRIPGGQVLDFLEAHPEAGKSLTTVLAKRLDRTSQILHGLQEFLDQLPDAVMISDQDGAALSWNNAAMELYGLDDSRMRADGVGVVFSEPGAFRQLVEKAKSGERVVEKVVQINHPVGGLRYISTSMTALKDANQNFQGIVSLGRDVTKARRLERRLKALFMWLVPLLLLVAGLAAVMVYGFPYFVKGRQTVNIQHQEFSTIVSKDFYFLKKLLAEPMQIGDRDKTTELLKEFFRVQSPENAPYEGIVLLDGGKAVFDAYSPDPDLQADRMVGNTYARHSFSGDNDSLHRVLKVYRRNKKYPDGRKGLEIPFMMKDGGRIRGWIIFQMDPKVLRERFGLDREGLLDLHF